MKNRTKLFFTLMISAFCMSMLVGCAAAESEASLYERIQKTLTEVQSYKADADVKYISNENTNTYQTIQTCKSSGEYKIEVTGPESAAGNITIYDGKAIYQYNKKIEGKLAMGTTESMERGEIFFTSFLKNYLSDAEVSITVSSMDEGKTTMLEAQIPGDHPYISSEKLFIDNETLKPLELIIYDADGIERIVVSYHNFEYNVQLDENTFKTETTPAG